MVLVHQPGIDPETPCALCGHELKWHEPCSQCAAAEQIVLPGRRPRAKKVCPGFVPVVDGGDA